MKRRAWLREKGYDKDFTKSTFFIMPMIGYVWIDFDSKECEYNYLINCYLSENKDRIILILDHIPEDKGQELFLLKNELNSYLESTSVDDENNEIVLTYKIPEIYLNDFNIFLNSKYSKMSQKYKAKLIGIYGRETYKDDHRANQFDTLYPTRYKRKQLADYLGVDIKVIDNVGEVCSELNMDFEIYKNIDSIEIQKDKQELKQENRQQTYEQ